VRTFLASGKVRVGFSILAAFGLGIMVARLLGDPAAIVAAPLQPPSSGHLLGTTGQGQDVLAQTLAGAGPTLLVALSVGLLVTLLGLLVGVTAGYLGGGPDGLATVIMNVFLLVPGLPLAVVLAAYLPAGPKTMVLVLVVGGWAWNARVLRAQTLALRQAEFVQAAIAVGESTPRILVGEILPNLLPVAASCFISATIYALGAEVGLEFLGIGDLGRVTWGTNLYWAANDAALLTGSWWTFVPTGVCLSLVGCSLVLVNLGLDEVMNPRLRRARRKRGLEIALPGENHA
jgi:ABC-type dipeptide/oligopeptide/nickel transport system permease subunit